LGQHIQYPLSLVSVLFNVGHGERGRRFVNSLPRSWWDIAVLGPLTLAQQAFLLPLGASLAVRHASSSTALISVMIVACTATAFWFGLRVLSLRNRSFLADFLKDVNLWQGQKWKLGFRDRMLLIKREETAKPWFKRLPLPLE